MEHETEVTFESLLAHTDWVDGLARRLVRDPNDAADVVQNAWVALLKRPPVDARNLRGYLSTVVRNTARRFVRTKGRRRDHEEAAATRAEVDAVDVVLQRASLQREMIERVLGLPLATRSVLLLHFFEGLSTTQIAVQLKRPRNTVQTQLRRGVEELRGKLDQDYGDRSAWGIALAPLVRGKGAVGLAAASAPLALTLGGSALLLKGIVSVALIALVIVFGIGSPDGLEGQLAGPSEEAQGEGGASMGSSTERLLVSHPVRDSVPASVEATDQRRPVATEVSSTTTDERMGQVVIRDVDGRELSQESGALLIRPIGHTTVRDAKLVAFRNGQFPLEGLPEGRHLIEHGMAESEGTERLVAFDQALFELGPDEAPTLVGHYLPFCNLRVVDARTLAQLDNVRVLPRLPKHAGPEQEHPGPHFSRSFVVKNEQSPVRLSGAQGIQSYWVTAKGYSWSFIQIDSNSGGEREVQLEPAGRLVVNLAGHEEGTKLYLRVYHHETQKLAAACRANRGADGTATQHFPGLADGSYDVRAELGPADEERIVLGEARVDVRALEVTTVLVEVDDDQIPAPVRVRLELVLPFEHRTLDVSMSLQPAAGPTWRHNDVRRASRGAMEGDRQSQVLVWSPDPITPGRYLLIVEPIQHRVLIDVPPSADEEFKIRIDVPALFPVSLRAIDKETRQPIPGAMLRWCRERQAEAGVAPWDEFHSDAEGEGITLLLPAGPVSIVASSPKHAERSMEADIGSGPNQLTLELSARIPLEFVLMDGDTVIPWTQEMTCHFRSLDSEELQPCENPGDGKLRACFERPGSYEITIGSVDGFRQPEPVIVTVGWSELAPVLVHLAR